MLGDAGFRVSDLVCDRGDLVCQSIGLCFERVIGRAVSDGFENVLLPAFRFLQRSLKSLQIRLRGSTRKLLALSLYGNVKRSLQFFRLEQRAQGREDTCLNAFARDRRFILTGTLARLSATVACLARDHIRCATAGTVKQSGQKVLIAMGSTRGLGVCRRSSSQLSLYGVPKRLRDNTKRRDVLINRVVRRRFDPALTGLGVVVVGCLTDAHDADVELVAQNALLTVRIAA